MDIADLTVFDMRHAEVIDDLINEYFLPVVSSLELEASCKCECFSHCELCKEHIILHNISCILLESVLVDGNLIVEENIARKYCRSSRGDSISQDVKQTSLACTGTSHDVGRLAWRSEARDFFHNMTRLSFVLG